MTPSNESEEILTIIKELIKSLEIKIDGMVSILQKFGLDVITKLGKNELRLKMLTDKVEDLHKSTIDIKGLLPQMNKVIESQKKLENEIELIRTLIQKANFNYKDNNMKIENVKIDKTILDNKNIIAQKFKELQYDLDHIKDANHIKKILEALKEKIFELTGGHKILYEISQEVNKLKNIEVLDDDIKKYFKEKIGFWINKI
ncbi:MAG: hypothetical protein ACTSPD_06375 [Promethearchaeota archaeon]